MGSGQFEETASVLGLDSNLDGRALAYGDIDNDGDLDLIVSNRNYPHITVLRNDHPGKNRFLGIHLEGTKSNRQAIGSRIDLQCDQNKQTRLVTLGEGFLTQNTQTAWFGLGDCKSTSKALISWASGSFQTISNLESNKKYLIQEGNSKPELLALNQRNYNSNLPAKKALVMQDEEGETMVSDIAWNLSDVDGNPKSLNDYQANTFVINFWATWCIPCRKEIADFKASYNEIKKLNVELIGISLDQFQTNTLKRFTENKAIPYPVLHDPSSQVFNLYKRALKIDFAGVPISVIVHEGKIRKKYIGPVHSKTLLKDLDKILN